MTDPTQKQPETSETAVKELIETARRKLRQARRINLIGFGFYMSLFVPLLILEILGRNTHVFPCLVFGFLGILGLTRRTSRLVTESLAGLQDVRAIPALLESMKTNKPDSWPMMGFALQRLLPKLTSEDTALFTSANLGTLNGLLKMRSSRLGYWYPSQDLKLAILPALAKIGDSSCLPTVTRLANSQKRDAVQQAAAECLAVLEVRAQREKAIGPLLRPVEASPLEAGVLLRSSVGTPNEHEAQLVRPADEGADIE